MLQQQTRVRLWSAAFAIAGLALTSACDLSVFGAGGEKSPDLDPGEAGGPDAPFPTDAWVMGAPVGTAVPHFAPTTHQVQPNELWAKRDQALPTNAFYLNFGLGGGTSPVNFLPFIVRATNDGAGPGGLGISMPSHTSQATFTFTAFNQNFLFGALEPLPRHQIVAFDNLSATLVWQDGARSLTTPLVRGMPYVTALYEDLTPRLSTAQAVLDVRAEASAGGRFSGRRFEIDLNNGQTWILYASAPIELTRNAEGLVATAPFSGALRFAVRTDDAGAALLDAHSGVIPLGGDVGARVAGDTAELTFTWRTQGDGELLALSLPHHADVLVDAQVASLGYRTIRGDMRAIVGNTWKMQLPLQTIGFNSPRPVRPDVVDRLKASLAAEPRLDGGADDPYFGGKGLARLGRLALIADELGETGLAEKFRGALKAAAGPWLDGTNPNALLYDQTWGGIISTNGQKDSRADFGGGNYNDHHFQYGYHIYAAAVLAKSDPDFVAQHDSDVRELIREIANPSREDAFFTQFRNMDFFESHSWAAGIFEFGDGRNQESTSEAVNAWYGMQLYGQATNDANITNLGRLLLALELRGTQKYWQIKAADTIYDPVFTANRVVGVLWGLKAEYATFFGGNVEFIHGIQMLPYTPITEVLLDPSWIKEELPVLQTALTRPDPVLETQWRGIILGAEAILDADTALAKVDETLVPFDDGATEANLLYWIATRPN